MADAGMDIFVETYFVANDVKLKLFCNNYTPLRTSAVGNFTEASGGGYAAKTLSADSHTVESGSTPHDLTWGSQTFTFTGPLSTNTTIYGFYITDVGGTHLLWAQRLDTAFTPASNGDNLEIVCKLQYSSGTPA